MPGNEVGDRVHNFFEPEHFSQGQRHSQIADGNWAVVNNNLWVGSQRQFDALSSKTKDYSPQQSDLEARNIDSRQVQHGLNSPPPTRSELPRNLSHNQHPGLNGNIYGHQFFQTRPDEAIFLGVGTESDRNDSVGRGFSIYGQSQGSGPEHPATSAKMDSFESPVGYDFFGGQSKMSDHPGMLQSLPQQQSGFSDMHQLQQQLMFRKMEELQRQKDIQQLHARQQHSLKQVPPFTRQISGNHSHDFINGTPVSDASQPWATELRTGNTNWLHHASSAVPGSTGGRMFSPGQGQASHSVNQQVDQSVPGVPISSLRDNLNQYQFAKDKSVRQMATYNNSVQGNHYAVFPEQVSMQEEHVNSRHGFQGNNMFGHTSHQGPSSMMNLENLEQLSPLEKNVAMQEFQGKQEIVGPSNLSHNKIVGQSPSSQNPVALDPAEEKILFGSDDDSIWDAFGKKAVMNGGAPNILDDTEFMNGLPSIQSGSWSALMQSAVAETSSSDVGLKEDWTKLSIQNSDRSTGNDRSSTHDAGKHHTPLVDNNLPISSAFTIGSVPPSDNTNLKNSFHNCAQGFLQFGQKKSQEHVEGLQSNSSHRPIQQSPAGGSNWLNSGNQSYGSGSHSVDADMNGRRYSNHRGPPQNGSSQPSQPYNWSVTSGATPNGDMPFDIHENENYVLNSQNNGQKRVMHESLNFKDVISKVNSVRNSSTELEQLRSTSESSLAGSSLNAAGAVLNSTKSRASEETCFLDGWKPMEALVKTQESEHSQKSEHLLNKGPHLVESAFHNSEEVVKMHEMDIVTKKENHNASYRSNMSNHNFTAGSRESDLSDASDSQSLAGGKQKSFNQVGRKFAGPRKFQYHPMGNLDEDVVPSYQMRQANHSKMMPLHSSQGFRSQDKGFFGQSKQFGQFPKGSGEKGKGQLPDHQGDINSSDEVSFRGNLPGNGHEMSSALEKSVRMTSHSSENMLELLDKVDRSKERSRVMHHSSNGYSFSSQTPEAESSDGNGGCLQQNQSSAAQGFGLQLAPPSQRPGLYDVSSSPSQTVIYSSSTQATGVEGDNGQRMLDPTALGQSMPSPHEVGHREFKNKRTVISEQTAIEASPHKMQGNFSSDSGFPYPRSQLQDQLISKENGQVLMDSRSRFGGQFPGNYVFDAAGSAPYDNTTSSLNISRPTSTNYPHDRVSAEQISAGELLSVSQSITTTGVSQKGAHPKMLSNIWPNVPPQQQYVGAHDCHAQPKPIQSNQPDIVKSTFSVSHNLEDQGPTLMDDFPSEAGAGSLHPQGLVCEKEQLGKENSCQQVSFGNKDLVQNINESPRKEPGIQQNHRAPPLNPPSTQRDIEAFGRTLKPNNFIQQNFSLANQIRAMKNVETDQSNRGSERLKGHNDRPLSEQVALRTGQPHEGDAMVEDPPFSSSVPSIDPKMHCFSEPEDYGGINASSYQTGRLPSQDMLAFNQVESENFLNGSSTASVGTEHPNISPQMAPSWFNQYGSLENRQRLQGYDACKAVTIKTVELPFKQSFNNLHTESGKHIDVAADTNEISNKQHNATPALQAIEHISSLQSLLPDNAYLVVSRPKKRKCATFELQSWQKEVSQSCPDLQSLRVAEANWAKAANRLSEQVEDHCNTIDNGLPKPRARRRLSITRQLMQLLFPAPPAVILSVEATLNYETVAYFLARRAVGDTCSLMSCSENHSDFPSGRANLQADKRKALVTNRAQHTAQVMEDYVGRVRKLETELSRLDKRASVSDLRMEVQDVEKISIINRFAMFHSRLQADGADISSLPGAAANSQKPFPQRFVTAVPLPRNLPDSVQCLSL